MKIPVTFSLTDISETKLDKPISMIFPIKKLKYNPIIKPLSEWIRELKENK